MEDLDVIVVTGIGTAMVEPDRVRAALGISIAALSVGEALTRAAGAQARALEVLRSAGIPSSAMQTSGYRAGRDYEAAQGSTRQRVDVSLHVTLPDVATAGDLLARVSDAVGEGFRVDAVWPHVSDPSAARRAARTAAVIAAREQAEELAAAAGVSLGRLRSLVEGGAIAGAAQSGGRILAAASAAPEVEGGESTVRIAVTVTYEILA
jgi:uncharacterized protein YggE